MDKDRGKNTGMIGLGAMGFQMARHMVRRGFAVTGYDVAPEAASRAKQAGIRIARPRSEQRPKWWS